MLGNARSSLPAVAPAEVRAHEVVLADGGTI